MVSLLAIVATALLSAAAPNAADLDKYLAHLEPNYSNEHQMLGTAWNGPGYHSKIPNGTWVHTTRGSLDYALALLARGRAEDVQRAEDIIVKVISLQDQRPQSRSRGIWPWLLEEPIDKMEAPDYNWADFCGAVLAQMLHSYGDRLSDDLRVKMRDSLRLAAEAIKRRNVGPDYTNIALMGGGVCAAAGELLDDNPLLEYGRSRLQRLVEHTKHHGSFNEFNSPTYTMVALREAERTLLLVRDEPTRAAAEWLRRRAWQTIAESFHPGTLQWCGPHSRAYSDYVDPPSAQYLSSEIGIDIIPHPKAAGRRPIAEPNYFGLPCPKEFRPYFQRLTESPHDSWPLRATSSDRVETENKPAADKPQSSPSPAEIERQWVFVKRSDGAPAVSGTAWFDGQACFGTANTSTFWTQARPVLAYWRTDADPAVVFRLRFFHDGRDFASMGCTTVQHRNRALVVVSPRLNQGSWHLHLDRSRDGIFRAKDFRLVCQLRGSGSAAAQIAENQFELRAGGHRMIVHSVPPRSGDQPVVWRAERENDTAHWSAVLHEGEERSFHWRNPPPFVLALGIELLRDAEQPSVSLPKWNGTMTGIAWEYGGDHVLKIDLPSSAKR